MSELEELTRLLNLHMTDHEYNRLADRAAATAHGSINTVIRESLDLDAKLDRFLSHLTIFFHDLEHSMTTKYSQLTAAVSTLSTEVTELVAQAQLLAGSEDTAADVAEYNAAVSQLQTIAQTTAAALLTLTPPVVTTTVPAAPEAPAASPGSPV